LHTQVRCVARQQVTHPDSQQQQHAAGPAAPHHAMPTSPLELETAAAVDAPNAGCNCLNICCGESVAGVVSLR
jgi:hypothetical protein